MMTYFQRNTFLFTAWCQMLLNVFFHYDVTAESYLHYNKGIFFPPSPQKRWAMQTAVMGTRNWETERLSNAVTEPKGKGGSDIKLILKITLKLMLKGGKVCAL